MNAGGTRKARLSMSDRHRLCNLLDSWRDLIQRERLHLGSLLPMLRERLPGVALTEHHVTYAAKELNVAIPRRPRLGRELAAESVPAPSPAETLARVEAAHAKADGALVRLERMEEVLRTMIEKGSGITPATVPPW